MPELTCPECGEDQEVNITVDTYIVTCVRCGNSFDIPRKHRVNKREVQEFKSRVNIRVGYRKEGDTLKIAWTVQSADKGNQYLERETVSVDVNHHPEKTYWYVAIFKTLQHINEYKSARIWVKHAQVIDHLSGDLNVSDDDLRARLVQSILELCDEKFFGCEFSTAENAGYDIKQMLS